MNSYRDLIKLYKKQFKKFGDSVKSQLTPKGRNNIRYSSVLDYINFDEKIRILDYGCGLGYFYEYLNLRANKIEYSGVDIVDDFIIHCKNKFPEKKDSFYTIKHDQKIKGKYDIIFASGVFNLKSFNDEKKSLKFAYERIKELFESTNQILICDFPSEFVDFKQSDAQHFNTSDLISFCVSELSRRFIFRHDLLPYECTLIVWKDDKIVKPQNTYEV
jgi:SAM-dependent methyltransferase|tara:strand:+ start:1258 stop:1908 length:651 start_codon:yes stop_codon:yes gene_type:complete